MRPERAVKFFLIIPAEDKIRLRNEFRLLGANKLKDFVVQLEVQVGPNQWMDLVRFDLAHTCFHCDLRHVDGRKEPRIKYRVKNLNDAATLAVDYLKENLEEYLSKLGFSGIIVSYNIKNHLERAKQFLLNLIEHPEKIDSVPNEVSVGETGVGTEKGTVEKR